MTPTTYSVLDFFINGVLFWICIALLMLQAYNVLFHKGIPNIRTAPALRMKIIELMKESYLAREKDTPF